MVALAAPAAVALAAGVVGTAVGSGTATAAPIRVDVAADGSRVVTLIDPRQSPDAITLPAGFDGTVVLTVGVATAPGQPYDTPSDPFALGEPLAGFDEAESAAAVARAAKDRGLRVQVIGRDGEPVPDAELGDESIMVAIMVASDSLLIRLA